MPDDACNSLECPESNGSVDVVVSNRSICNSRNVSTQEIVRVAAGHTDDTMFPPT